MSLRSFPIAESLEILFGLFATTVGQTIARQRVGRLGGARGHFLFDALGYITLDVRSFDETTKRGGSATRFLPHLRLARICCATIFGAITDAAALPHSLPWLAIRIDFVLTFVHA